MTSTVKVGNCCVSKLFSLVLNVHNSYIRRTEFICLRPTMTDNLQFEYRSIVLDKIMGDA